MFKKELIGLIENRNNNDPYNILTIFEKEPKDYNFLNGVSKSKNIGKFIKNYTIGFMLNGHILYFDTIGFTAINTLGHNKTKITLYIKVDGVTDKLPSTLSNSFDLYIKLKVYAKDKNLTHYIETKTTFTYREDFSCYYINGIDSMYYSKASQYNNQEVLLALEKLKIDNVDAEVISYSFK